MEDWEVYVREAVATGMAAQEEGLASVACPAHELREAATRAITRAREETALRMREGLVPPPPEGT